MLVVQEKSGPAAARQLWKIPTGLTDLHEDIVKAIAREVKEETRLSNAKFQHAYASVKRILIKNKDI